MPTFPPSFLDGAYGFLSDSEYVSKFPPRRELPIEPMVGPSPGEEEFETEEVELALYGRKLTEEERKRSNDQNHALLYTDGHVAVTIYECSYAMWYLNSGKIAGGSLWKKDEWKLSDESRSKILKHAGVPQ